MSSDPSKWVIIDDTSPQVQYLGDSWFADVGTLDSQGTFGPPYRSTLHGTKSSASLSFSFNGTAVIVAGTMLLRNDAGVFDPKWDCFVDGRSIGPNPTLGTWPESNKNLCGPVTNLVDGQHTITVNVTVARGQAFWFDNIQYAPSPNADSNNTEVMLKTTTADFMYGPDWSDLRSVAVPVKVTSQQGSKFTYDFNGVSLAWYGVIPPEFPGDATTGTYSIDGGTANTFLLQGHQKNEQSTIYHQKFFETSVYPAGNHRLSVEFGGNLKTTPLTLYYLVVENGTVATTMPSTAPSANPTSGSRRNAATIPTPFIFMIFFGLIFFLRRNRRLANVRINH